MAVGPVGEEERSKEPSRAPSAIPIETARERVPADHPGIQIIHLRQVLGVLQWGALTFIIFCVAAFAFLRDPTIGLSGVVILAFLAVTVVAKRYLERGNRQAAVVSVCAAILVSSLTLVPLQPGLLPTSAVTSLVAAALALPYASERALKLLMVAAWLSAVIIVLAGPFVVAWESGRPISSFGFAFGATTLAAAAAIVVLLLWQFRTRLMGALEQTRRAEEQARHEAIHDHLTDLPNRAFLEQRLCEWLSFASPTPPFAVLFLDLDRFKNVNDSLGHHLGDKFLQVVARRLSSCIRPHEGDVVARLGGDEFVVVLGGAYPGMSEAVATRIQEALKKPVKLHGHELYATASIGILPDCSGYGTPEEILRDADTAMFRAKESGKARPTIFEPSMRARAISQLRFETDLRRAVERSEFIVHYEPIVWLATGGVVGFEASLRWTHPERGLLSSEEFMPLAQKNGLGHDLDQPLLAEACRRAALWRENFPEHFPPMISVDLSADTLFQEGLTNEITRILERSGLPAHALTIGFSEETITESPEKAIAALRRLKSLNVRLAMDDFGTGRSSLGFLHRLPADTL